MSAVVYVADLSRSRCHFDSSLNVLGAIPGYDAPADLDLVSTSRISTDSAHSRQLTLDFERSRPRGKRLKAFSAPTLYLDIP